MEALIETRSKWGKLIITQDTVKVEPLWGEEISRFHRTIQRSDIISVEGKKTGVSVFGQGGGYTISLRLLNGETFELKLIPRKDGPKILQILDQNGSSHLTGIPGEKLAAPWVTMPLPPQLEVPPDSQIGHHQQQPHHAGHQRSRRVTWTRVFKDLAKFGKSMSKNPYKSQGHYVMPKRRRRR